MYVEKRATVINKLGLHARAVAKLTKLTGGFNSTIRLVKVEDSIDNDSIDNRSIDNRSIDNRSIDNRSIDKKTAVDAKSIMAVMMLAATQGTELHFKIDGDDAKQAAEAIGQLIADRFGEDE